MDELFDDPRWRAGARFRTCPLHVDCPARCAFCYERRMSQLFPWIRTVQIPPYDERAFGRFAALSTQARAWEAEHDKPTIYGHLPALEMTPEGLAYYPNCDAFGAGLSADQLERIVRLRRGDTCVLYTAGFALDPDVVGYLTRRYPETVRFHFSLVTFDAELRRQVMHPGIDVDALRRACALTRQATFFLLHFGSEQILSDVAELERLTSPDNGGIYIHRLYYNRLDAGRIVRLAQNGEREMDDTLRALAASDHGERVILLSPGSTYYADAAAPVLQPLLQTCHGTADEVVFCSGGAERLIAGFFSTAANRVVALPSAFGGNVDFIQGTTARAIGDELERLLAAGATIRRAVLPDGLFWIEGGYDLNGDNREWLAGAFPQVEFELLHVHFETMGSVLSLEDCANLLAAGERADG